ncbi:MAG: DNA-processing protein DprA [Candidatus Cryptobacteroides sp.]
MYNKSDETVALCALNKSFGSRPKTAIALLEAFGSACSLYSLGRSDLDKLPRTVAEGIQPRDLDSAARELAALKRFGVSFIGYTLDSYPRLLKECPDPPVGLYVRGNTPPERLFAPRKRIAVVGTRDATAYGTSWCSRLVDALGRTAGKPAIVSGLAFGIDIAAHRAAISAGLPTIAVLATSPNTIYPALHSDFARQMCETPDCAIISDYPPGTPTMRYNFVRRNRIIAGLCDATVLIESAAKGGGMITANLAFSYSREVYALPGRIDDIHSAGCNRLIRAKVAEPISDIGSFIEALCPDSGRSVFKAISPEEIAERYKNGLPPQKVRLMTAILSLIMSSHGITAEDIATRLDVQYNSAAELVFLLEADSIIRTDLFQRCFMNAKNP